MTGGNLCTTNGIKTGSVTKKVCANTPDVCEVYIKKGSENGVNKIKTCRQYCNAYGIDCAAQYEDKNGCGRDYKYVHTERAQTHVLQIGGWGRVCCVLVVLAEFTKHAPLLGELTGPDCARWSKQNRPGHLSPQLNGSRQVRQLRHQGRHVRSHLPVRQVLGAEPKPSASASNHDHTRRRIRPTHRGHDRSRNRPHPRADSQAACNRHV